MRRCRPGIQQQSCSLTYFNRFEMQRSRANLTHRAILLIHVVLSPPSSLFRSAASSLRRVGFDEDCSLRSSSLICLRVPSSESRAGRKRLMIAFRSLARPGAIPCPNNAIFACHPITTSGSPLTVTRKFFSRSTSPALRGLAGASTTS
jgi:hypothetical protein